MPSAVSVTVPFAGLAPRVAVSVVPASTSVSLAEHVAADRRVFRRSSPRRSTATGASFTPVTVIVTVATFEAAAPSLAV